jgi:hypothetical protein
MLTERIGGVRTEPRRCVLSTILIQRETVAPPAEHGRG